MDVCVCQKALDPLELELTEGSKLWMLEPNPDPAQEQQALLPAESSL